MPVRLEFATAGRILFGAGVLAQAGAEARVVGEKALVVTGRHPERAGSLLASLEAAGVGVSVFPVPGEPDVGAVEAGAEQARAAGSELVIGFGGGSAIDAAKAMAAMATNAGPLLDHLEVVGRGRPLRRRPLPCLAIPTTAGAGAEVTRNAVVKSVSHGVKASLRSPLLLPVLALVDPLLTHSLPPSVTAATGIDALTQLIEPFVSQRANPLVDGLCREGLRLAGRSLRRVFADGADASAREGMALASLLGGMALANAGLGAVHGFAAPLGGMFDAPHGAVCAALLPHVMVANLRALRAREPGHVALARFGEVGRLLTGATAAGAEEGVAWIVESCELMGIPGLGAWGVGAGHVRELVTKAMATSSMKGNPILLTEEELTGIAEAALGGAGS